MRARESQRPDNVGIEPERRGIPVGVSERGHQGEKDPRPGE